MSNKQLSVCVYPKTKINIMLIIKIKTLKKCSKCIHTTHCCLVLKSKSDCPFADRRISQDYTIITEVAEDNGGICSFKRKLQYLFINKMRTRPIINLNVGLLQIQLIEKCDIQVVIKICAVIMITIAHTKIVN